MNDEMQDNTELELNETDRALDQRLGAAMRDVYLDRQAQEVGERVYQASVEHLVGSAGEGEARRSMRFEEYAKDPSSLPERRYPAWVVFAAMAASILIAIALVARFSIQATRNNQSKEFVVGPNNQTGEDQALVDANAQGYQVDSEFDDTLSTQTTTLWSDISDVMGGADDTVASFGWDSYEGALSVEIELAAQRLWDGLETRDKSDG